MTSLPENSQDGGRGRVRSAKGGSGTPEDEFAARLRALDEKLDARREAETAQNARKPDSSGMGMGLRLASDFVAAVLVGAALGWGIDRFFGIAPWGMIVLLLLGFCAGVLNVLRSAGKIADPRAGLAPSGRPEMYDDEDEAK